MTVSVLLGAQEIQKRSHTKQLRKKELASSIATAKTIPLSDFGGQAIVKEFDESIIREQLSRNYLFFGEEGMAKIRGSFVIIVGVGGVGSWAATMLVRSGVGRVRIIDFDQVTLSSLNRHAVAVLEDVGSPKVKSIKNYLAKIAPWIEVDARAELFRLQDAKELLSPWKDGRKPDFVIDAIDNTVVETKADLLAYCHRNEIRVIASMGAGCKSDPTRVFIADISETTEDPLSRATRRHLKWQGIRQGIPTVFSTEKPGPGKATLTPLDTTEFESGKVEELGILPEFRVRILPVMGTMPGVFGLTITTFVLTTLAGYPTEPVRGKNRLRLYESMFHDLTHQSKRIDSIAVIPFTTNDIAFVVEEVYNGKSSLPPHYPRNITATRYRRDLPLDLNNIIVVTKEESKIHERMVLDTRRNPAEFYSAQTIAVVEQRLQKSLYLQKWRDG